MMKTTDMIFMAQTIMQNFFVTRDASYFEEILSDDAEIILTVNGQTFERNKSQYVANLRQSFSENIVGVEVLSLAFEVLNPSTVKVLEKSIQHRNGLGLNESAMGLYYVDDLGHYTFKQEENHLKVAGLEHAYTKIKIHEKERL